MIILGIDPGYARFGVAVIQKGDKEKERLLFSDCIQTDKNSDFYDRLNELGESLEKIIKQWKPDTLSVENLFLHKNQKTSSRVSEVRGMAIYVATKHKLRIFEYTPLEVKLTIAGFGKADKKQVEEMVKRTISLPTKKRLDDEYDAIAVGLTCLYRISTSYPQK